MNPTMIVSLFAAGWLAQPPQQAPVTVPQSTAVQGTPVSGNLKVRISTSTYMPDGRVLTASASDWPLRLNEAMTAYVASGKTMCEPKAASLQQPELPVPGWRVEITPIREGAGELEIRVQWRPLGVIRKQNFARLTLGSTGPGTTLTLHAGDRVVLDYMSGKIGPEFFVFSKDAKLGYTRGRLTDREVATLSGCTAVGMSLEVGLEPAKTEAIVEAELWLVRPNRDGSERSDRQVLRVPVGQPASRYFFDEARLADRNVAGGFAKVSGELSVVAVENGRIRFNFNVMRKSGKSTDAVTSSTFRDLTAAIGEVVAFKLMPDKPGTDPPLSIRMRASLLR